MNIKEHSKTYFIKTENKSFHIEVLFNERGDSYKINNYFKIDDLKDIEKAINTIKFNKGGSK